MLKRLRLTGALLFSILAADRAAAATEQGWELWIVKPGRPGIVQTCSLLRMSPSPLESTLPPDRQPLRLDEALSIRWQGGYLVQDGAPEGPAAKRGWNPADSCFVLMVAGKPVAAGAVLPRASAQLLRFDTLVVQEDRAGQRLAFELLPHFPADVMLPAPAPWAAALGALSRPSGATR